MASPLIDIPSPSEAITSIPNAATMAIKKTRGLHFSLPLNRPLNRLRRHKTMTYTKSHNKVTHQRDLPETSLEHSEAHHSQMPFTSGRANSKSASSSLNSSHNLDVLSADVQLQVFSFLDLPSLRNMMATNRDLRALLVSDSAYQVWHKMCQSKFFLLEEAYDSEHGMFLQDECALPIAAVSAPNHAFCRYNRVNLPLLLSMTPDHVPTGMMMMADQADNDIRNDSPPPMIQILSDDEEDDSITDGAIGGGSSDDSFVSSTSSPSSSSFDISLRFNGNVGSGQVYSVKANHPLPKPTLQVNNNNHKKFTSKMSLRHKLKSRRSSSSSKKVLWNPMVVPYNSLGDAPRMIHVTPRLVSYFEISILAAPEPELRRPLEDPEGPLIQDCVAIGLATPSFEPRGTLPGWCSSSFGYHSDNGGLYHGSGHARQRTESFGPGDTVGMGVDYVSKTIFVTKNGRYLGSAYDVFTMDFLATQDLYPVVGMDSKDTVNVNYGVSKPFHFNLASYCQRQQQNMVPVKSRISTKFQFTHDHSNGVEVGC